MPAIFNIFLRESRHPATESYLGRLRAAGGDLTPTQDRAHTYLAGALQATGLSLDTMYALTFFSTTGSLVVPFLNQGGTQGNCTPLGTILAGGYVPSTGLVCFSGSSGITLPQPTNTLPISGFWLYGAFSMIGSDTVVTTTWDVAQLRIMPRWNGDRDRVSANFGSPNWSGEVNTTPVNNQRFNSGRLGFVSESSTSFKAYMNGVLMTNGTSTTARGAVSNPGLISLNDPNQYHFLICGTVAPNATQLGQIDAAIKNFLTLVGRPNGG